MSATTLRNHKKTGSAFIAAVIILAVLTIILTTFATRLTAIIKTERIRIEQRRAEDMAFSGLARALATIELADLNNTTNTQEWFTLGQDGNETFRVGAGAFRIQIIDAGSLVNINTANEEQLRLLNLTDEQIDSLLDWRSEELQPRPLGAKDEFYNSLNTPYNTRLRRLETIDELFLVKGFTPATLYQQPENVSGQLLIQGSAEDQPTLAELLTADSLCPNQTNTGNTRTNLNNTQTQQLTQNGISEAAATAIVQRRNTQGTFTTMSQVFQVNGITADDAEALLNNYTVTADVELTGKINLNTASEAVLNSIPGITSDITQSILARQGSFEQLGELATIPGVDNDVLQQVADIFTVSTQMFIIRIEGQYISARHPMQATVVVRNGLPSVVKVRKSPFTDYAVRWQWPEEPQVETILLEQQ